MSEPGKNTHQKLSREDIAKTEIGHTQFAPGTDFVLIAGFILLLLSVPSIQLCQIFFSENEKAGAFLWQIPATVEISQEAWTSSTNPFDGTLKVNDAIMNGLERFEKELEDDCYTSRAIRECIQPLLCRVGVGNEKAIVGRAGWLFYEPDVSYLTGPGFLNDKVLAAKRNSLVQPNPLIAIQDMQLQLARRGISLVIMPIPVKSGIHPDRLKLGFHPDEVLHNTSYKRFIQALNHDRNILYFDCGPRLKSQANSPQYLKTDTHWRPEAMQMIAQELAAFLRQTCDLPVANRASLQTQTLAFSGHGDIAGMLQLPENQSPYPSEKVELRQITGSNNLWRPSQDSPVLILGDSFTNIYSLEGMGWGESAGFAEQLSYELGLPIDVISRNDAGSYATRQMLANELSRGRDRLAGKKVVIYEFAARELAMGDWKFFDYSLKDAKPSSFYTLASGQKIIVTGQIASLTSAPRPGSVPYRDHVICLHLVDLESEDETLQSQSASGALEALIYTKSMADNKWLAPARYRVGERVTLQLSAWSDVANQYDALNRADPEDEDLLFEEPCWGEPILTDA